METIKNKSKGLALRKSKGFTLLELLIVIAILAVLSVTLVLVLNPTESLRKARDVQRMSDLATLKTAIGLYMTSVASPTIASTSDTGTNPRVNFSNDACQAAVGTFTAGEDRIYYSVDSTTATITDEVLDTTTFTTGFGATQVSDVYNSIPDGTGWLPIKLSDIIGGSPISNFPVDPTNSVTTAANGAVTSAASAITNGALVYRYACSNVSGVLQYEIDAILESTYYGPVSGSSDDKSAKDGGDNSEYYEVGTNLLILGAGIDF